MNRYEVKIVETLLKKYYKRKAVYKDMVIKRRIDLPVNKILKDYSKFNVDLNEKELVNKAIRSLEDKGFVTASKIRFSDDYEKVYLCMEQLSSFEQYAANELDITPRSFAVEELQMIINNYQHNGKIADYYIAELENLIANKAVSIDVVKEEDILKILSFLEKNTDSLYIREASMLIFGDSKYFENNRRSQVNAILYDYFHVAEETIFEEENLLERFNVYDTDQDICVKGPVIIEFRNKMIDITGLSGGVSFSIKDIDRIVRISVRCGKIITVENKTSFLRMDDENCYVYLGGFATKSQVSFLKKMIADNSEKEYLHFGDIDAGGFWIHKKLCEQTEKEFSLCHMGIQDLEDERWQNCLNKLTDLDVKRLINLKENKAYTQCIAYMLNKNVKLEQEIISLYLTKENGEF